MNWNKELIVFGVAILISVLACGMASQSLFRHESAEPIRYQLGLDAPPPPKRVMIPWQEIGALEGGRNPFELISEWRTAPRDPLPIPALGALQVRVPLPAVLAGTRKAVPPREESGGKKK